MSSVNLFNRITERGIMVESQAINQVPTRGCGTDRINSLVNCLCVVNPIFVSHTLERVEG